MKGLESGRAQKEEAMWSMVCFDTSDVFSHPCSAGGHFKTSTIIEKPFECPVVAL